MEWTGIIGVTLGAIGVAAAVVVAFLIIDRLMGMARRLGWSSTQRLIVAVVAILGGPLLWLVLWWFLREPRMATPAFDAV